VGNIVARDVENLAVVGEAPDEDVGVGMAGVVVIDSDPVEPGAEVLFHLVHEVAGEAAQVAQVGGVLGAGDEAELVTILPAPGEEGATVGVALQGRVGVALSPSRVTPSRSR
jgi:hypothetical protein